jgi:hypothetical protein
LLFGFCSEWKKKKKKLKSNQFETTNILQNSVSTSVFETRLASLTLFILFEMLYEWSSNINK